MALASPINDPLKPLVQAVQQGAADENAVAVAVGLGPTPAPTPPTPNNGPLLLAIGALVLVGLVGVVLYVVRRGHK